jgi:hypothetical protein
VLCDKQVCGGGDGQKLGDSLDDSEDDDRNPIRHRLFRDEKSGVVKNQNEGGVCSSKRSSG